MPPTKWYSSAKYVDLLSNNVREEETVTGYRYFRSQVSDVYIIRHGMTNYASLVRPGNEANTTYAMTKVGTN